MQAGGGVWGLRGAERGGAGLDGHHDHEQTGGAVGGNEGRGGGAVPGEDD